MHKGTYGSSSRGGPLATGSYPSAVGPVSGSSSGPTLSNHGRSKPTIITRDINSITTYQQATYAYASSGMANPISAHSPRSTCPTSLFPPNPPKTLSDPTTSYSGGVFPREWGSGGRGFKSRRPDLQNGKPSKHLARWAFLQSVDTSPALYIRSTQCAPGAGCRRDSAYLIFGAKILQLVGRPEVRTSAAATTDLQRAATDRQRALMTATGLAHPPRRSSGSSSK
jgi:hypothetical protein